MAAMGFWIFLAVVVIARAAKKINGDKLKHETLRLLIEKNQKLDEAQLKELLNPAPSPPPEWLFPRQDPGDAYKFLRVSGVIIVFIALGLLIAGIWRGAMLGCHNDSVVNAVAGVALIGMLGAGLFVSSRFLARPSDGKKSP
jgi:hypothetical protein